MYAKKMVAAKTRDLKPTFSAFSLRQIGCNNGLFWLPPPENFVISVSAQYHAPLLHKSYCSGDIRFIWHPFQMCNMRMQILRAPGGALKGIHWQLHNWIGANSKLCAWLRFHFMTQLCPNKNLQVKVEPHWSVWCIVFLVSGLIGLYGCLLHK